MVQKIMEGEGELVIDEGSGDESEEGECSSDGEEDPCNLLGIPIDSGKQPVVVEDEMKETGSEEEGVEINTDQAEEQEEGESRDRIRPEKLMQLG